MLHPIHFSFFSQGAAVNAILKRIFLCFSDVVVSVGFFYTFFFVIKIVKNCCKLWQGKNYDSCFAEGIGGCFCVAGNNFLSQINRREFLLLPTNKKSTHLLLNLSFRLGNVFKTISRRGEKPKAHFPRKTIFYNAHQKWQKFACQAFILLNDNERALTRFQQISEMIKLKKKTFYSRR